MTTPELITLAAAIVTTSSLCFLLGWWRGIIRGYIGGHKAGIALGWQEAFFEQVEKEKSRRGRDGRFVRKARK